MINVGDTVLVTIPTYWPGFFDIGTADPTYALQTRLQSVGMEVVRIDATALSYWGDLGGRKGLLVTVRPYSSAFGYVQDVAGLVAGAANAVGFDINAGSTGAVVGYANPSSGQPSSQHYDAIQNAGDKDTASDKSFFDDISKALGISKTTAEAATAGIGILIVMLIVSKLD